jgi:hypothetical protein
LSLDAQLDLKTSIYRSIYRPPLDDLERRRQINTEIEAVPAKIGGGNIVRVTPRRFSTLSNINTIITAMKKE